MKQPFPDDGRHESLIKAYGGKRFLLAQLSRDRFHGTWFDPNPKKHGGSWPVNKSKVTFFSSILLACRNHDFKMVDFGARSGVPTQNFHGVQALLLNLAKSHFANLAQQRQSSYWVKHQSSLHGHRVSVLKWRQWSCLILLHPRATCQHVNMSPYMTLL